MTSAAATARRVGNSNPPCKVLQIFTIAKRREIHEQKVFFSASYFSLIPALMSFPIILSNSRRLRARIHQPKAM
nr:hypothetical protein Iba_chr04eCG12470 [Ipomoea batatas]